MSEGVGLGVPVRDGVKVAVEVAGSALVGVLVGEEVGDTVGVGSAGQPSSAAFTAASNSSIDTMPSPLRSIASHIVAGASPSAIFTPMMISFTDTSPLPSQSPTQMARAATRSPTHAKAATSTGTVRHHPDLIPCNRARFPMFIPVSNCRRNRLRTEQQHGSRKDSRSCRDADMLPVSFVCVEV